MKIHRSGSEKSPNLLCLVLDSGPLMILGAGLIATHARVFHTGTPLRAHILSGLKILYPSITSLNRLSYCYSAISTEELVSWFLYVFVRPSMACELRTGDPCQCDICLKAVGSP